MSPSLKEVLTDRDIVSEASRMDPEFGELSLEEQLQIIARDDTLTKLSLQALRKPRLSHEEDPFFETANKQLWHAIINNRRPAARYIDPIISHKGLFSFSCFLLVVLCGAWSGYLLKKWQELQTSVMGRTLTWHEIIRARSKVLQNIPILRFIIGTGITALVIAIIVAVMPKTAFLDPPRLVKNSPEITKLVIFIHGWNGDEQTWGDFPEYVNSDPTFSDADILLVHYLTYMWQRQLDISELAEWINEHLDDDDVKIHRFNKIVIIAHSMGGLVARHMINLSAVLVPERLGLLIEIATPHTGANYAAIAAALGISADLTNDLKPGSKVLKMINQVWRSKPALRPKTICYTSPQDSVVPSDSAHHGCDCAKMYSHGDHQRMVKPIKGLFYLDEHYALPMKPVKKYFHGEAFQC